MRSGLHEGKAMHIALGRAERAGWLVGLCLGIHRLMKMPRSIGYPGKRGWTYDDRDGTFRYTGEKSAEIPRSNGKECWFDR